MKVSELREALAAKGIKTTTKMRKPELEKLLFAANEAEVTELPTPRPQRREYAAGGNVGSLRALRRRQPEARARQARRRQIKRYLRSQGEQVCMNPGSRNPNKGKRS